MTQAAQTNAAAWLVGAAIGIASGLFDNERVAVHYIVISTASFQFIHCFNSIV
jgi:uncharacterized protein YebE (UPF0316 family)